MLMTSCVNEPSHPIVGHAYGVSDDQFYFDISGRARFSYFDENMEYHSYYKYTYEIHDDVVTIYYDKSNFWKESARGTYFTTFTYDASRDVLIDVKGGIWSREEKWK